MYWWDHELEWDAEDYEAETGMPMPAEAKYQNVYLVANGLTEFLKDSLFRLLHPISIGSMLAVRGSQLRRWL